MKKLLLVFLILTACSTPQPIVDPNKFVPTTKAERDGYLRIFQIFDNEARKIYVSLSSRNRDRRAHTAHNSGKPFAFFGTVRRSIGERSPVENAIRIADPNPAISRKILRGEATERELYAYVAGLGQSAFCNGGRVTPNRTSGFSYSSPEALAAIMIANNGAPLRNGIIPRGVKKTPAPPIEPRLGGVGTFDVRMRCSLWTMP